MGRSNLTTVRMMAFAILGASCALFAACGGGGSDSSDDTEDLWVERFSAPNFSGIRLDEAVSITFSEDVKEGSLNHDSIRMRTGPAGGEAPRGTFVKGIFLVDPESGNRVVIDPEAIGALPVRLAEKKGEVARFIPIDIRYDRGAVSNHNGLRQVLFNRSFGHVVTFVPEVPTRPDLSDTGYKPGTTYTVVLPAAPATNTVLSVGGDPLLPRDGRVFTSTFTTVSMASADRFQAAESDGPPRVVHTSPQNNEDNVSPDRRVVIRFSHPLDPTTIITSNIQMVVDSVPGKPEIPISLFLAQTRLGYVEIVITPLQDLPADQFLKVFLGSGITDLKGRQMTPFEFSFSTGDVVGTPGDIIESFDNNINEDPVLTTANWNGRKPFLGQTPGALTAVFAPFAGNGSDLALNPAPGDVVILETTDATTLTQKIYNFTTIDVQIGAAVLGMGTHALVMRAQGDVNIGALIDVSGGNGGVGNTGNTGETDAKGGEGGAAGPGGAPGGDGAFATIGDGGNFHGQDGFGEGRGAGGGTGDQESMVSVPTEPGVFREAGGGAGHATAGEDSDTAGAKGGNGGRGGPAYGEPDFSDAPLVPPIVGIQTLTLGFGGSGGGGGGGEDDAPIGVPGGEDEGGGGGGGGGGALQITTYGNITVDGRIDAGGGDGGNSFNVATGGLGQGAAGGGGSGGGILLQAFRQITLDSRAEIEALGGLGGQGDGNGFEIRRGGDGADGYIRLEDTDGSISVPSSLQPQTSDTVGTYNPPLSLTSTGQSRFYNQFFPTPDYGAATVDMDTNGGTIEILVQGSSEDLSLPGNQPVDPDTDTERLFSTDWVPIAEIDRLDNFQYLRFQVNFTVDPLHDFADPLPIVREIHIPAD